MTRRNIGYNGTRAEALDVLQMDTEPLALVAAKISCKTVPPSRARDWSSHVECVLYSTSCKLSRPLAAARTTVQCDAIRLFFRGRRGRDRRSFRGVRFTG
jgi:hypothetical protein